ncbi:mycothiol synthase [Flexivirga aerilata]|uniref:mycothiol synthase n=1 Tax=Flexivirga aerilata TaxID=1656889 RepID=UPI0031B5B16D
MTAAPPPAADELLAIAARATAADRVEPFSEATRLALRHTEPQHVIRTDGAVTAGAYVADDGSAEIVVDPDHRRRGHGERLATEVLEQRPDARLWAHGDLLGARAIADKLGLQVVRNLWQMRRAVDADPQIAAPQVPEGFTARTFRPGDEDAWLDLNARAFVHHPEQGRMTRADLDERMSEEWWDPQGLILIVDDTTGDPAASAPPPAEARGLAPAGIVASHWTKIEPADPAEGEVYVVAVDPGRQGHGLGKVVTALGLQHLKSRGVQRISLYVEGDNEPAVATYTRLGFARSAVDVMYARP